MYLYFPDTPRRYGRPTLNYGSHVCFENVPPCNLTDEIISLLRFYVFQIDSLLQTFRKSVSAWNPNRR